MATEKAETDRVPITLALSTITYLEKLVRQGTHGTSVPGVARTLIEEGIRLATKDGLLSIRYNSKGRPERAAKDRRFDCAVTNTIQEVTNRTLGPSSCLRSHPPGLPNASRC